MSRTLVISEPGCTAEGDYDRMLRLIHVTAAAGADCFKAQYCSDPVRMCERRHISVDHPKRAYYLKAYSWLNYPAVWHEDFARLCKQLGLKYACTSYLPEDVAVVDPFVDYHKISSFEAEDPALLEEHRRLNHGKDVWISTGMLGHEYSASWLRPHQQTRVRLRWFHCVSAYPTPLAMAGLALLRCQSDDGDASFDGYSDHTCHVFTGALAAATGVERIETHVRLDDCNPENPDYAVAFSPREFVQYVQNIRLAEAMMGDGVKRVQPCEEWALPFRVT